MVKLELKYASAANWPNDDGARPSLVPGVGFVTIEADVDLRKADARTLAAAAAPSLPKKHEIVAFAFDGRRVDATAPGAPLAALGVKRGDVIVADVRREAFALTPTSAPVFGTEDDAVAADSDSSAME